MTAGERWYRRLLRLYPKDFREEFGGEMTRDYRDRGRDEPWWRLWIGLVADLARTAPSEHVAVLRQDLRQAARSLRRTPIVAATAALTLALGVGASTTVFSLVYGVLLRPLPYPEPAQLVELFEENLAAGSLMRASALNYRSWAEQARTLDAIGAFRGDGVTLTSDTDAEMLSGAFVTASFFRVLRTAPLAGRPLQADDDRPGGPRVVVIGEALWRSRFGGDPAIVGRRLTLDGERHEVVGVMPRAFRDVGRSRAAGGAEPQIFLPLRIDPASESRGNHTLRVIGRLRRGVTLAQARDDLRTLAAALAREFPATNTRWSVRIEPLMSTMFEPQVRQSLGLVLGAVMLVFVIASANVANLMIVRGSRRHGELAVRTALGASRARLVRQLFTESALLAAISGAAGVLVAGLAHPALRALLPPTLPRLDEIALDSNVLAFGVLLSVGSGLAFGVAPALRASRVDLSRALTPLGRATPDRGRVRLRQLLIVGQIGLATMLLVSAALLLQGFVRLQRAPLGFAAGDVLTARVSLPRSQYPDAARAAQFFARVTATLTAAREVQAMAIASSAPFGPGVRASFPLRDARRSAAAPDEAPAVEGAAQHIVSGEFFRVLGVPLLAGRTFSERDVAESPAVAVVSERVARALWPDTSPLGQALLRDGKPVEVVGVVGDVRGSDTTGARGGGLDRDPRAAVYFAAGQQPQRTMTLLVSPRGDAGAIAGLIRAAVREADPALPVQPVRPLGDWLDESLAPTRLTTLLAGMFALIALLLASVGIYGVLAFIVAARTREIGVRLALGASRSRVLRLVFGQGLAWTALGILLGLAGAVALSRLLETLLFDVPARDPATFAAVAVTMALVAGLACTIPAARAVRIDPTTAMRLE